MDVANLYLRRGDLDGLGAPPRCEDAADATAAAKNLDVCSSVTPTRPIYCQTCSVWTLTSDEEGRQSLLTHPRGKKLTGGGVGNLACPRDGWTERDVVHNTTHLAAAAGCRLKVRCTTHGPPCA